MTVDKLQAKYFKWINKDSEFPKKGVLYRAVVVDNVDPEKFGRVKVLIEGLGSAVASEDQAIWAWVNNYMGGGQESGKKYGSYMPPMTGAKVFVLFEPSFNAMANPVIIGGWHQQEQKPIDAYDRYDEEKPVPNSWGYQTPNGHILQAREEKDHYQIEFKTPENRRVIISDQKDEQLVTMAGANGNEVTIYEGQKGTRIQALDKNGNTILMDAEANNITIMCKENIFLKSKNIYLMAEEDITGIAAQDCSFTATTATTIQGKSQTLIGNESCQTNIEGATIAETATSTITMTAPTITMEATAVNITAIVTVTGSIAVM